MGDKHIVRFEPVGIEIEVDEDQTILRAAAEQGVQLMHGCKEGQCAACKSFVLEGEDIELDTLLDVRAARLREGGGLDAALPGPRLRGPGDRAPQLRRGDDPVRPADPEGHARRWSSNEPVTHDMRHLVLRLVEPDRDQVLPRPVHGLRGAGHRTRPARSRWRTRPTGERPVRVRHQDLPGRAVLGVPGREGADRRPAGGRGAVRHLHAAREPHVDLLFVGGGAGHGPHARRLLRSMAERGVDRKATFYYGARTQQDLCFER